MKTFKYKKFEKIEIDWLDSLGDTGWCDEDYYKNNTFEKDLEHKTCGYFLDETPRSIRVVQSRRIHPSSKGKYTVDHLYQIPKVAILKIKKIM